jgi:hypothetical protein
MSKIIVTKVESCIFCPNAYYNHNTTNKLGICDLYRLPLYYNEIVKNGEFKYPDWCKLDDDEDTKTVIKEDICG